MCLALLIHSQDESLVWWTASYKYQSRSSSRSRLDSHCTCHGFILGRVTINDQLNPAAALILPLFATLLCTITSSSNSLVILG